MPGQRRGALAKTGTNMVAPSPGRPPHKFLAHLAVQLSFHPSGRRTVQLAFQPHAGRTPPRETVLPRPRDRRRSSATAPSQRRSPAPTTRPPGDRQHRRALAQGRAVRFQREFDAPEESAQHAGQRLEPAPQSRRARSSGRREPEEGQKEGMGHIRRSLFAGGAGARDGAGKRAETTRAREARQTAARAGRGGAASRGRGRGPTTRTRQKTPRTERQKT